MKTNSKSLSIVALLCYILMIIMNILAVTQPLNGVETGAVSDRFYNLFTPAGFTFSIWSVIYTLLLAFVISRIVYAFRNDNRAEPRVLSYFIISCLANAAWLVAWHNFQLWIGVAIMFLLLLSLIRVHIKGSLPRPFKPVGEKVMFDIPFSIYLGWISVAIIANVSAALVQSEIDLGGNEETWAVIMVIAAALLALLLGVWRRNLFYAITICWGLFGILKAREQEGETLILEKVILASIGTVLLFALIRVFTSARKHRET